MFISKDILDGADVAEQEKEDVPPMPPPAIEVLKHTRTRASNIFLIRKLVSV